MPHLHDMHCHVDLYADYQGLIEECEQESIYTLAVTNTPSVFHACVELTRGRRYVRPALGLHPELVAQRHHELALISDHGGVGPQVRGAALAQVLRTFVHESALHRRERQMGCSLLPTCKC